MNDESPIGNVSPSDRAWWDALRRVTGRVIDALEQVSSDPACRDDLRMLVRAFRFAPPSPPLSEPPPITEHQAAETDVTSDAAATPPSPHPPEPEPDSSRPSVVPATAAPTHDPLPAVILGPRVVAEPVSYPRRWTMEAFDPARVAERCRTKARATRWQIERRHQLDEGKDVADQDHALVDSAREQGVFLWMVSPSKWRERTESAFTVVAECYDAIADAAELMQLADALRLDQDQAMRLLGEAQSALRAAVEDYGSTHRDEDQAVVFDWLREQTYVRRIWVQHMQADHPASPADHAELRRRIAEPRARLDQVNRRGQQVEQLIGKVAYHARKLSKAGDASGPIPPDDDHLRSMTSAIEALLEAGVPPSHPPLRDVLLPIASRIPRDLPDTFVRVMEAIDDYRDQTADNENEHGAREPESSSSSASSDEAADGALDDPLLLQARECVGGRHAVMIGGMPKTAAGQALQTGLGLASLNWLRVEHQESFDSAAAAAIRRSGVGLVILMTRWRSHRDGPAARALCKELGIPLVELPAGYNLRQVAHQIVQQLHTTAKV